MRIHQLAGIAFAAAFIAAPSAAALADEATLTARGNEPSFLMSIGAGELTLEMPLDGVSFRSAAVKRSTVDGHPHFEANAGGKTLAVTVEQRLCADTMTGMPFPVAVSADFDGRALKGCGGSTLAAIEGGWRVLALAGKPVPGGVTATIEFAAPDHLSGKSGCNRFFGGFKLDAEHLAIGPLGGTRMACPDAESATETSFLMLAERVTRVTPGENGRLKLMAGDTEAMLLDRAD